MRHALTLTTIALATTLAAGCATQRQNETAAGTGVGAAAGAVLGKVIGGTSKAMAVGAAVGASAGAAAGYNWQLIKEKLGMATKDSGVQVTEQNDGSLKVNMPAAVSFPSGSSSIDARLHPTLDRMANTLNEYPASTISVTGHTDSVGGTQFNQDLSLRRADAVANYLTERHVQRNRMSTYGQGEATPVADNTTETGRAQNRRVEMVIRPANS